jgi:cystathionine beta-lyase/cystathionine gamma-synthase
MRPGNPSAERGSGLSRTNPVVPPIYQSTTFVLDDRSYKDIHEGGLEETWYSRFSNPTVDTAAAEVANLEGAEAALMTSSGMSAIATTLLTILKSGTRMVAARELYGDTRDLLVRDLPRLGVEIVWVDADRIDDWRDAAEKGEALCFYAECLSNPQLKLLDIPAVSSLAQEVGAVLIVDNTFATPYMVHPLRLGADLVVHSATKFLNGHSDVIAGSVVGDEATVREIQRRIVTFGGCLDPHAAFLVRRGLKTFDVRLARQTSNAQEVADFLEGRKDVVRVDYPGLASYRWRKVAEKILEPGRTGAMVTFVVEGGDRRALAFMRRLKLAVEATSLGGVETLVSAPFNSSHFSLTESERQLAGIDSGMVRLSVGIEQSDLIINDIGQALDQTA